MNGKLLKGNIKDKWDLIEFLLKAGQGDKIARVIDQEFDQISRMGDFH